MTNRRTAVKVIVITSVIVGILVAGYFYLPMIIGDSVFPLKYQDTIKKYCQMYNEDPFLVAGIIMQESGFNPQATSPVGAMGIMQIMPPTGRSIASGVGYPNFTPNDLYNPEIAIQFGTWHIHVLKEKYGGNEAAALAAYNGGTGNADKWLRAGLLNNIPGGQTNRYVRNVQDYVQVYHKLYQNELQLAGSSSPTAGTISLKKQEEPSRNVVWGRLLKELVKVVYNPNQK